MSDERSESVTRTAAPPFGGLAAIGAVAAAVAIIFLVQPARAGASPWSHLGPDGVLPEVVSPGAGGTVYATAGGLVFRSDDSGATWTEPGTGFYGLALQADPVDPGTVYAGGGNGTFRSFDGARSWSPMTPSFFQLIAIAPSAHQTLYALGTKLWRSTDSGASWLALPTPGAFEGQDVHALVVSPADATAVYAGTSAGVVRSSDGGNTFGGATLPGSNVLSLAIDPSQPQVLYAGTATTLYRSADAGATWVEAANGLGKDANFVKVAVAPAASGSQPILFAWYLGRLFRSLDGAKSWTEALAARSIVTVAAFAAGPNRVFASVEDAGLLSSLDDGSTFAPAVGGFDATFVSSLAVDPHTPGTLLAAVSLGELGLANQGVARSSDGGVTWAASGAGLAPHGGSLPFINRLVADSSTAGTFYAAVPGGPGAPSLFKTTDGGATWQAMSAGMVNVDLQDVAIDPRASSTLFAAGFLERQTNVGHPPPPFFGFRAFTSANGGASWTPITGRLVPAGSSGYFRVVRINPRRPSNLYIAGSRSFRSMDGGITWQELRSAPTISDLVIDPSAPWRLIAATQGGQIQVSSDRGNSWQTVYPGVAAGVRLYQLAVDPRNPAVLYCGGDFGLLVSTDHGATWSTVPGLPVLRIPTVVIDAAASRLYAGTAGASVYANDGPPGGQ